MNDDLKCQVLLVTHSIKELHALLKALVIHEVKPQYQVMFAIATHQEAENLYKGIETAYNIGESIKHITKLEQQEQQLERHVNNLETEIERLITERNNLKQDVATLINDRRALQRDNRESSTAI